MCVYTMCVGFDASFYYLKKFYYRKTKCENFYFQFIVSLIS